MPARSIDVHAHVCFRAVMGRCGGAGPEMGVRDGVQFFRSGDYVLERVRFIDAPFSDLALRLELMERLGVDHQLLSPNPLTYFYRQPVPDAVAFCRAHNDEMAATVAAHPARFTGLAQLPMQDPTAAAAELERAVSELGLAGSYVGSDVAGRALSERDFDPVWAAHERLDVPVVVHPAPPDVERAAGEPPRLRGWDLDLVLGFAHEETMAVAHLLFGGVLDRHPRLHVHVPHGGGAAPYLRGRFEAALARRPWAQGLLSRPFEQMWRQLSFDCLVRPGATMRFLVEAEGADRVMLGTNFAGWDQDDGVVDAVRSLPIDPADRDAVLAGNARRLFRLAA